MNKRIAKKIWKGDDDRYSMAQWRKAQRVLRRDPSTLRLIHALSEWFAVVGPVVSEITYTYTISEE